ncbi:Hypothetical predicted protein, partial [Podarcis lilfordi]
LGRNPPPASEQLPQLTAQECHGFCSEHVIGSHPAKPAACLAHTAKTSPLPPSPPPSLLRLAGAATNPPGPLAPVIRVDGGEPTDVKRAGGRRAPIGLRGCQLLERGEGAYMQAPPLTLLFWQAALSPSPVQLQCKQWQREVAVGGPGEQEKGLDPRRGKKPGSGGGR